MIDKEKFIYIPNKRGLVSDSIEPDTQQMVFIHIPKCGGNSFGQVFRAISHFQGRSVLSLSGSQHNYRTEGDFLHDIERHDQQLESFNIIYGHFPYSSVCDVFSKAQIFTILRHPIERLISAYYYVNRELTEPDPDGLLSLMKTEGILNHGAATDNIQVRMLCSQPGFNGNCTNEMLDEAKYNLESKFKMFGLVDSLNQFLIDFVSQCAAPPIVYKAANTNPQRPDISESSSMGEIAAEYNRFDLNLYQWAEDKLSLAEQKPIQPDTTNEKHAKLDFIRILDNDDGSLDFVVHPGPFPEDAENSTDFGQGRPIEKDINMFIGTVPI